MPSRTRRAAFGADEVTTKGTPSDTFKFRTSKKQLKRSYEIRLAAQFGGPKEKRRLRAYNRAQKERKMEANVDHWEINGKPFNRYKMMEWIVAQTAAGELLSDLCKKASMPSMLQVYSWFDNHPEFETAYRRAERARGHLLGDEVERTARNTDRENVTADKLKCEILGKAAARLNERFQDKAVVQNKDDYSALSADQIKERILRMAESNPELLSLLKGAPTLEAPKQEELSDGDCSEVIEVECE